MIDREDMFPAARVIVALACALTAGCACVRHAPTEPVPAAPPVASAPVAETPKAETTPVLPPPAIEPARPVQPPPATRATVPKVPAAAAPATPVAPTRQPPKPAAAVAALPVPAPAVVQKAPPVPAPAAPQPAAAAKRRWWSRPLVALLYFLLPLARGWARHQGRLLLRPAPLAPHQTLESAALRDSGLPLREVQYWAEQRLDRLALVAAILRGLDQQGWPNKFDAGWSDYDVEVYDNRWTRLQLTTVVEEHPRDRQLVRCRLRARWALRTKVAFWSLGGFELLICGFVGPRLPWLWLVLLPLPLIVWFLRSEQRNLQSMIVVFLDELAKDWSLTKLVSPDVASQVEPVRP